MVKNDEEQGRKAINTQPQGCGTSDRTIWGGRGGCNEPELVTGEPETLRGLAGNKSLFSGMSARGTRHRGLEKRQSWTIRNLWIYKLLDDLDRNLFSYNCKVLSSVLCRQGIVI